MGGTAIFLSTMADRNSAAVRNLGESWSSTDYPAHKVSHRWTINKFRTLCKSGIQPKGAPFSCGSVNWHLELNPSQDNSRCYAHGMYGGITDANVVQIKLVSDTESLDQMVVEYTLSLVSQCPKFECKNTGYYSSAKALKALEPISQYLLPQVPRMKSFSADLITQSELLNTRAKELLVNDELTILCDLTLTCFSEMSTMSNLPGSSEDSLSSDLGALLQDTELSDITLAVGVKEFPAHRIILAARSPVFKAMFHHDMREKTESRLDIADLSADAVQGMLQWIYTGRLPSTEQESKDLLCASDKYNLVPLKTACERSLCQSLEVSNAVDLFELADLYRAAFLKSNCMRVIATHPEEVKATERWQQLKRERADLLAELLAHFMDR